ncbi:MAG: hypothetical protein RLZ07_741, partial [Pseudomonadota bacterium]
RGNAEEAAAWARERNYTSLAVVTAGFHLPRAMLEFRAILPMMDLYPYRAGLSLRQHVLNGSLSNLYAMGLEPVKYIVALLRINIRALVANRTN